MKIRPVVETRHLIPGRMRSADGFEEGLGCQPKVRGCISGEFDDLSLFVADLAVQLLDVSCFGFMFVQQGECIFSIALQS